MKGTNDEGYKAFEFWEFFFRTFHFHFPVEGGKLEIDG